MSTLTVSMASNRHRSTYIGQVDAAGLNHHINVGEGEGQPGGGIQGALEDGGLRQDDAFQHVPVPQMGQVKLAAHG